MESVQLRREERRDWPRLTEGRRRGIRRAVGWFRCWDRIEDVENVTNGQDCLYTLWAPVQNENACLFFKKYSKRIPRWRQQNLKPSIENAPLKLVLHDGIWIRNRGR